MLNADHNPDAHSPAVFGPRDTGIGGTGIPKNDIPINCPRQCEGRGGAYDLFTIILGVTKNRLVDPWSSVVGLRCVG